MKRVLKFTLGAVIVAAAAGALLWSFLEHRANLASQAESDSHWKRIGRQPKRRRRNHREIHSGDAAAPGYPDGAACRRHQASPNGGIRLWRRTRRALSFCALRFPGPRARLPDANGRRLGDTVADGTLVGSIEPRLAPADRITLADRLSSARAEARRAGPLKPPPGPL